MGQELATGILDKLTMITNTSNNPWVALIVDFKCLTVLYGDLMGGTVDNNIEEALTWQIQWHTR